MNELDAALDTIRQQTGLDKFELIGMDACLMSHLEVFSALAPHARFAVASQETEPAVGWAYSSIFDALSQNPDMDGGELGRVIVSSYIEKDQRILDDEARSELTQGGRSSAQAVAAQMGDAVTLTAVDLEGIPALNAAVNNLAGALTQLDQRVVAQARNYAQSYTSIFGHQVPPSYIDIGHFAALVSRQARNAEVTAAAEAVREAVGQAVIAEKHGPKKPGSTGISIYFPNSQLYRAPAAGPSSYTVIARRFASQSAWDDYLAFHYTGRPFEVTAQAPVVPDGGAPVRAPGAGVVELSPLQLSADTVAIRDTVLLSTNVNGENIGHIYFFAGYYDEAANSINISDLDYLESGDTREINGVYYPDWGEGTFKLEFEWEPIVFALNDGTQSVPVLLSPESYGVSADEAVYTVDGIYTYQSGDQRAARLYLSDGQLRQVFGFANPDGTGAPREIIPEPGDTFTVYEQWMDLDADGKVKEVVTEQGRTLTFGDQPLTWRELDAAAGEYQLGFIVEDLDGNRTQVFDRVTVQ